MVIPIIILVAIPIFLGLVFVSPFDESDEVKKEVMSKEADTNIVYFLLIGIWILLLIRILFQIKKGTFKATQKY